MLHNLAHVLKVKYIICTKIVQDMVSQTGHEDFEWQHLEAKSWKMFFKLTNLHF